MDELDGQAPPTPRQPMAPPAALTGCFIACGFALLPIILYVGSFAYLVADAWNDWGVTRSLDEDVLNVVYAPLIWLFERTMELTGFWP